MLALRCEALDVYIEESAISQRNVEFGLSGARSFGTGNSVRLYYKIPAYSSLVVELHKCKAYGEEIKSATPPTFIKWAIRIRNSVSDGIGT